jgi:hypothetical protein
MVAGVTCVMVLTFSHQEPFHGVSAGFIGLCVNVIIVTLLSVMTD